MNQTATQTDHLYPLKYFYEISNLPLPAINVLPGEKVPEPARYLLVHESDMTPRLSGYFNHNIHLEVLSQEQIGSVVKREVILQLDDTNKPVEFGAIQIDVSQMPDGAAEAVQKGVEPLGSILSRFKIPHESHPSSFFAVESDQVMKRAFNLSKYTVLFGRCNTLTYQDGSTLADVVEVLPPIEHITRMESPT